MKNLINNNKFSLILMLLAVFIVLSCRSNEIPEDIHEHEEIEKVELKVIEKNNPSNTQTIAVIGGIATPNLVLENGKSYDVSLDFFVKHGNEYESLLQEITEEKEEHFVLYQFSNADISVKRANDDIIREDGTKIGIKTEWKINVQPQNQAFINIKLNHGANSVNANSPSAENQLGAVTGGESDVDVNVAIN